MPTVVRREILSSESDVRNPCGSYRKIGTKSTEQCCIILGSFQKSTLICVDASRRGNWFQGTRSSIVHSPLSEFLEGHPVWESFSADTDTFQNTITPQLMQYKWRLDHTSFLMFIWNNAAHKMRTSAVQGIHKTCKLFLNEKEDNRMNQSR